MELIDRIAAGMVLGATGGLVAFRAFRAWREFRTQRRALDLLVRSMTEMEKPERSPTAR